MKEKRIIYLIMGVCSILILLIGITTAWFEWKSEVDTNVTFNVSGLNITYEGEPTVIKGNLYPTMYMNNTDNIIHNFSLVITSNIEIYSKISLEIITLPDELKHESFRWNLYKDSTQISSGSFQNATVGTDLLLTPYETITTTKSNYTLYIWIDGEHYDNPLTMGGKTFEFKLKLEASQQDYATAEECFVFDESTGKITGSKAGAALIESYDVHPQCVANAQTNLGITEEEATTFCSGGEFQGYTIDGYISLGAGAELESAGIITNVVYGASCPVDVVIPSSINEVSVTTIGDRAFYQNNLTSVIIPDSVTTIGNSAFSRNNLTSVVIPDSVTTIGDSAFRSNNLTSVVIPDSVTTIGNYAFRSNNLTSVVIPNSVTEIGGATFAYNNLTSVVIPDSVTTIGIGAFESNNLTSVVIPDSVTTIGRVAFYGNNLTSVTIGNSVTTIGESVFQSNNLTSVTIPNSVTTIGNYAFQSNNLTSVVIPDSVTTIGNEAFSSNNLTSVVIPDSVTTIGGDAFSGNNLTSVVIPDSVTTIGDWAFELNNLTSVVIPDSVTTIGNYAFAWNNLSSVYIGANSNLTETTGIGNYAFSSSNKTHTSNGTTYVDNPNLTTIYNNSGKKFKWYYVTQGRNNSTEDAYNFITGTVPLYTSGSTTYNSVTITTGGNP